MNPNDYSLPDAEIKNYNLRKKCGDYISTNAKAGLNYTGISKISPICWPRCVTGKAV